MTIQYARYCLIASRLLLFPASHFLRKTSGKAKLPGLVLRKHAAQKPVTVFIRDFACTWHCLKEGQWSTTTDLFVAIVDRCHGHPAVRHRSIPEPPLPLPLPPQLPHVSSELRCCFCSLALVHPPCRSRPPSSVFAAFYTFAPCWVDPSRQAMGIHKASHTHDASASPQAWHGHGGDLHGWRSAHTAGAAVRGDGEGGGRAGGRGGVSGGGRLERTGTRRKSLTHERCVLL